jgi:proline dehydrogenase
LRVTSRGLGDVYKRQLDFCVRSLRIQLVCGSHNEASNMKLTRIMRAHQLLPDDTRIWFSQLLGMSDHISFNLANLGYQVVKYVPFGPVRSVMPYLIRRAEENTSVAGQSSRELVLIRREIQRRKSLRRKA